MPVVLSQHFSPLDRVYEDAEFSLYHYPRVYFSRIVAYEPFIYYRPLGESRRRPDSKHYFGHGILGAWFEDSRDPNYRFVPVKQGRPFARMVPLRDPLGRYYETETERTPMSQSAVRTISVTAYHRILAAGGVTQYDLDALPDTEAIAASPYPLPLVAAPRDALRSIDEVPPGAGYVPRSEDERLNVFEAAALQERARRDHQEALAAVLRSVQRAGGSGFYNNNIDLHARIGERRYLIEAKSINTAGVVVDRMRYGIGQLADYAYRYADWLGGAERVLVFAAPPPREHAWVAGVLAAEKVAFVAARGDRVEALNERAQSLPFANV